MRKRGRTRAGEGERTYAEQFNVLLGTGAVPLV